MRATTFEFRHRFWVISVLIAAGFACQGIDSQNAGAWLAALLQPGEAQQASPLALRAVFGAGSLLALFGVLLRTWGTAYLTTDVMTDAPVRTERVVADGPYRHTRNPLYFGNLLFAAGLGLMASRLGWVVITLGMLVFSLRLIGLEESQLAAAHSESFETYRRAVPRFVPSLRPRLPRGDLVPRWGQALLGETFMWTFVLALTTLTVTLDVRTTMWITMIGFILGILIMRLWPRERRSA